MPLSPFYVVVVVAFFIVVVVALFVVVVVISLFRSNRGEVHTRRISFTIGSCLNKL